MTAKFSPKKAPTVAYVRSLRTGGWGSFKYALHRAGVLSSPVADVPYEWQVAYIKTYRPQDLKRFVAQNRHLG